MRRDTEDLGGGEKNASALGDSTWILGRARLLHFFQQNNSERTLWDAGHRIASYSGYVLHFFSLSPWFILRPRLKRP
jgi:hypothetical protein